MKSDLKSLNELSRREFVASAAKACLGVSLLPMAGSYVHTPVQALQPGTRPANARHLIYLYMSAGMSHMDTFAPTQMQTKIPTKDRLILFQLVQTECFCLNTYRRQLSICTMQPSFVQ